MCRGRAGAPEVGNIFPYLLENDKTFSKTEILLCSNGEFNPTVWNLGVKRVFH